MDSGTAGCGLAPPPPLSETRTAAIILTEDIGFNRRQARIVNQDYDILHQKIHSFEWRTRTAEVSRLGVSELLAKLSDLGFAWRDIARLVGVSVPALQKWRKGERAAGESRRRLASLVAACQLIVEHYEVHEIASWFEMPLVAGAPLTPIDLYSSERADLVFEFASGHADPERVLSLFDPNWRERYRSDFEMFRAADDQFSIRPKAR